MYQRSRAIEINNENKLLKNGFDIVNEFLSQQEILYFHNLFKNISPKKAGMRNIFRHFPSVKKLATSHKVRKLVEPFLNYGAFAVRALYFDKTPDTNWGVGWHQDITVAVKNKRDVEGFSGWTMKAGTPTCSSSKRNIGENVDVKNFPG